jgi:hypothetical protein
VQIGGTTLKPGNYKVEWQETDPAVQVSFQQNGKTAVTVPGTFKANDDQVTQDGIVAGAKGAGVFYIDSPRVIHLAREKF